MFIAREIDKITPAGEDQTSRKTLYKISDHFFQFWYHFIFSDRSYLELIGPQAASDEIMDSENISNFMGMSFEQICCQYMVRMAKLRRLPFMPYTIGKWWGNNPKKKRQDDVDVLLLD